MTVRVLARPTRERAVRAVVVAPIVALAFVVCAAVILPALDGRGWELVLAPYGVSLVVVSFVGALVVVPFRIAAAAALALVANLTAVVVTGLVGAVVVATSSQGSAWDGLSLVVGAGVFAVAIVPSVIVGAGFVLIARRVGRAARHPPRDPEDRRWGRDARSAPRLTRGQRIT